MACQWISSWQRPYHVEHWEHQMLLALFIFKLSIRHIKCIRISFPRRMPKKVAFFTVFPLSSGKKAAKVRGEEEPRLPQVSQFDPRLRRIHTRSLFPRPKRASCSLESEDVKKRGVCDILLTPATSFFHEENH